MNKLKKNIIYSIAYQMLTILLPLITSPYLSRALGVEAIGSYSYVHSIASYFVLFSMLGIANYGNRSIALEKVKNKRSEIFCQIYTLQLILTALTLFCYLCFTNFYLMQYKTLAYIEIITVMAGIFDVNWLFYGLEKIELTVIRNMIVKIFTLAAILIVVKSSEDLYKYALILSTGTLVSQIILWVQIKKYVLFHFVRIKTVLVHIKPVLILFIPILSYSIYKIMDKIMLGNMTDVSQVGFYENAEKFINIPAGFITALGTVMMPRIASMISQDKNDDINKYNKISVKYFTIIILAISMGLIGTFKVLAPVFYGKEFTFSGILILILSTSLIFSTWANIIRTQYLIPNKKDYPYVISTIVGAAINLLMNFLLIPKMYSIGASIATVFAEASVFFVQAIWTRKEFPVFNYLMDTWRYWGYGIIMAIIVYFFGNFRETDLMTLILQIVIGGVLYLTLTGMDLYLTKDEIFMRLLGKARI